MDKYKNEYGVAEKCPLCNSYYYFEYCFDDEPLALYKCECGKSHPKYKSTENYEG